MKKLTYIIILIISFINLSHSQWEVFNTSITADLHVISAVNQSVVWVASGNCGGVYKTTDGGGQWILYGATIDWLWNVDLYAISEAKLQIIRLNSNDSSTYLMRTTNNGVNWTTLLSSSGTLSGIRYMTADSGLIVGTNKSLTRFLIWRTINGGAGWDSTGLCFPTLNSNEKINWRSLFLMGQKAWFCTNQKRVLYSSNFGTSWEAQQLPSANESSGGNVWFNSQNIGMVGCDTVPSSTTNGGLNWVLQTHPPGGGGTNQICGVIGYGNTFWLGYGSNICKTTNNGATWITEYTLTGGKFLNLAISRTGNTAWAVRDDGKICKSNNFNGIHPISTNVPDKYCLFQNYPNPFNPSTKIEFSLPNSSGGVAIQTRIAVYDVLGNEIAVLVNEKLRPGEYETTWDGTNYSSGAYFYRLTAGDYNGTKQMILVK